MALLLSAKDREWFPWDTGDENPCDLLIRKITDIQAREFRMKHRCEKTTMNARTGLVSWVTNDPKENAARREMAAWALLDSRPRKGKKVGLELPVVGEAMVAALAAAGITAKEGDTVCVDGKLTEDVKAAVFALADMSVVNDVLGLSDSLNLKGRREEEGKE